MTDEDDPRSRDHEALDLLGHELRLAIIERLAVERRENWHPQGLGFADLRKAVGADDAGQFNYHLDELVGTFVEKRDDEYVLTTAGFDVAGSVRAGTYADDAPSFSVTLDRTCVRCDRRLAAAYEDGTLLVHCEDHGVVHSNSLPPAAAAGRDPEAVIALADLNARNQLERALAGACVHCWGRVAVETPVDLPDVVRQQHRAGGDHTEQVLVEFDCRDCGMTFWTPASVTVVRHPAVVSLYHEHGVDLRERDHLDLEFVDGTNGVVESTDPVRVRVDVALGDDELHLWLDDTATVVDTERT